MWLAGRGAVADGQGLLGAAFASLLWGEVAAGALQT